MDTESFEKWREKPRQAWDCKCRCTEEFPGPQLTKAEHRAVIGINQVTDPSWARVRVNAENQEGAGHGAVPKCPPWRGRRGRVMGAKLALQMTVGLNVQSWVMGPKYAAEDVMVGC